MTTDKLEAFALDKQTAPKGSIQTMGLVGCGSMGQEIARLVSKAGIEVVFLEQTQERIDNVFVSLNEQLNEAINGWGITEGEKRAMLTRIKGTTHYSDLNKCEIVIETIYSKGRGTNLQERKEIFSKIETVVATDAIIASNISTVLISELANHLKYPERAVGLHFLWPPTKVSIVEAVKGVKTNDEAYQKVKRFAKMIGKKVIHLHESPGNISTRLLIPLINEACEVLMEGVASMSCIDETMKRGFGLQLGPFELADKIGLDKVLKWMENLYTEFGERKFKASPIIKRLVRDGYKGRETEKGFYEYENGLITKPSISYTEFKTCD